MHDATCDLIPSQGPHVKLHRIYTGTGTINSTSTVDISTCNHTKGRFKVPGPLWSGVAGQGQGGSESLARLPVDGVS